jgi:hypothetical protein
VDVDGDGKFELFFNGRSGRNLVLQHQEEDGQLVDVAAVFGLAESEPDREAKVIINPASTE